MLRKRIFHHSAAQKQRNQSVKNDMEFNISLTVGLTFHEPDKRGDPLGKRNKITVGEMLSHNDVDTRSRATDNCHTVVGHDR